VSEYPELSRWLIPGRLDARRWFAPLWGRVEQRAHDLGARHAVDDRVMDLAHHGHPVARQAVHQVQLPQRLRPVQRTGVDPGHLFGQLGVGSGRSQGDLADVELEVEVRIVDPVAVVEVERDLGQPPAKWRHDR
jgi:hypothetical protein